MKKSSGGGKNATSRPLKGPGDRPQLSAMIGGISNQPSGGKAGKGMKTFNRGGATPRK